MAIAAPAAVTLAQSEASPEASASPVDASPGAETINDWPGTRGVQKGLYSFSVTPGNHKWMHKLPVPSSERPASVELTFVAADAAAEPDSMAGSALGRSWWDGDPSEHPARVVDVRTQAWLVDVDDTRVAILLESFPDTDPALVAEAEAVVESIVVEPAGDGNLPRLVFRLLEWGWDSG
jgi:hypothetical protein